MSQAGRWSLRVEAESEGVTMQGTLRLKHKVGGHTALRDFQKFGLGKDPDAGKDGRQEERGRQRKRWLDGITDSMDMSLSTNSLYWHCNVFENSLAVSL